jgi:16S rRNA (cytidine1402-2'-O)-methyltransferase
MATSSRSATTSEAPVGRVVLVGTPIGNLGDLSPRAVAALAEADVICCEDTRQTRKLLSHAGIRTPRLLAHHQHNEVASAAGVVALALDGASVAVVSDAGMPGVSDPGAVLVAAAVAAGLAVEVIPGPSAVLAALVVSGLAGPRFCFEGFLPRKGRERADRLAALATEPRPCVLFEAPNRVADTVADLAAACGGERGVAVARELTKVHEEVWRGTLAAAVEHYGGHEPRGEFVLVLAGAPAEHRGVLDATAVEDALRGALERGLDRKAAVAWVTEELRLPRRDVYAAALRLKGAQG